MKTVSGPTIAILIRITKQMGAGVEHELCTSVAGVPIRRQSIILYYITVLIYIHINRQDYRQDLRYDTPFQGMLFREAFGSDADAFRFERR